MGLTNFILTVAGVGAVVLLLKGDVKRSASVFRRNVKHIRKWIEDLRIFESYTGAETIDSKVPRKKD